MTRRRWLAQMLGLAAAGLLLGGGSFRLKAEATPATATAEATQATKADATQTAAPRFADVTAKAGITFVHASAASPDKYMFETFGSGVAWIDFDNDGFVDLYFVNGAPGTANALYRNNGDGTFKDVTAGVGHGGQRQPRLQDRRRRRRLRQRRPARSLRHRVRSEPPAAQPRQRQVRGRHRRGRRGRRRQRVEHEHRVPRLRPRRRPRSLRRQLRRLPHGREPVVRHAPAGLSDVLQPDHLRRHRRIGSSATTATAPSPTSRSRRASPIRRARGSAWCSVISIATPTSTSTSPTTWCAISSIATTATAPSRTSPMRQASASTSTASRRRAWASTAATSTATGSPSSSSRTSPRS